MPQVGFHGAIGILGSQTVLARLALRPALRRTLIFGFILGNIMPDFDLLATVMTWLIDKEIALSLHRGFTHSLFAALLVAGGFSAGAALLGEKKARLLGLGAALGIITHSVADIFAWFAGVDLLWPLGFYGLPSKINIWSNWITPPLVSRLLAAMEFLAWALYYRWLLALSLRYGTNRELQQPLQRLTAACFLCWAAYSILALYLEHGWFEALFLVPVGVVFMPLYLYVTCRARLTVEAMAAGPSVSDTGLPTDGA